MFTLCYIRTYAILLYLFIQYDNFWVVFSIYFYQQMVKKVKEVT